MQLNNSLTIQNNCYYIDQFLNFLRNENNNKSKVKNFINFFVGP